jgi:hypothetical protein
MIRDTCLSPTKSYSYCSLCISFFLETLYLQSKRTTILLLLKAIIGHNIQAKRTTKNNAPIKKIFKRVHYRICSILWLCKRKER